MAAAYIFLGLFILGIVLFFYLKSKNNQINLNDIIDFLNENPSVMVKINPQKRGALTYVVQNADFKVLYTPIKLFYGFSEEFIEIKSNQGKKDVAYFFTDGILSKIDNVDVCRLSELAFNKTQVYEILFMLKNSVKNK